MKVRVSLILGSFIGGNLTNGLPLRCSSNGRTTSCIESWRESLNDKDRFVLGVVEGDAEKCSNDLETTLNVGANRRLDGSYIAATCGVPALLSMELLHVAWAFREACQAQREECTSAGLLSELRGVHDDFLPLPRVSDEPQLTHRLYQFVGEYEAYLAQHVWSPIWSTAATDRDALERLIDRVMIAALDSGYQRRILQWRANVLVAVQEYGLLEHLPALVLGSKYYPSRLEVLLELIGGPMCDPATASQSCQHEALTMVEIGVHMGRLSFPIMSFLPLLQYFGVDPYVYGDATSKESVDRQLNDLGHQDSEGLFNEARDAALDKYRYFGERARLLTMTSEDAARQFLPASVDGVFIDGDHSYRMVKRDIEAWEPKLRPGGFLSGHDFANHPDVATAVLEHATRRNGSVHVTMDWVWYWRV